MALMIGRHTCKLLRRSMVSGLLLRDGATGCTTLGRRMLLGAQIGCPVMRAAVRPRAALRRT
ncbi:hypothetical protein F511_47507 [Dorcoceras hygrometricum]|uniref:Uncharacterized protein n=1 Tax=Dorcoceras hygrometricum TaxID=472368 RepID=A0A2Z6ZX60_9LAMI|nr:hypothetical protein F511_47507 [Dorcoceras hygrometricum]